MARKSDSKSRVGPSRRAKPVLRSSARRSGRLSLGSILDVADDAIVVVDRSQLITGFNAGAARIFGYTAHEVIGKKLDLLMPERFVAAHRRHIADFAVSAESSRPMARRSQVWARRKDGSEFPAEASIAKVVVSGRNIYAAFLRDMSERKKLEQTLARQASVLATQQETSLDAVLLVDEDATILSYNSGFMNMWGIPRDLIGTKIHEPVLQTVAAQVLDPDAFLARVKYLYAHRSERSRDEIRTKDGRVMDRFTAPVVGAGGEYYGRVWYFRDITERKQAEDALRRTVAELSEAQRVAHVGSWRLDGATNEVAWTEELYRMLGFNPKAPPPPYTKHQGLFAPESWSRLNAALPRTLEAGVPYELELETVRADGSRGWMLARGEPLKDDGGKIIGARGIAQDITARKQAELNLERSEAQLRAFLNESPSLMFMKDIQGRYVFVNDRFKEAFGLKPAQVLSRTDEEIFPSEQAEQFARHDARALAARSAIMVEEAAHYVDGPHTSLVAKFPVIDANDKIINLGGIATDISEQKHAEIQLRRTNRALRVLSAINQALVRGESEQGLMKQACKALVDVGGYRLAWIGFVEHDAGKSVRPVAQTGYEEGYLERAAITWADSERGRGPTGSAVRTGTAQVSRDIASDPKMIAWRADALKRGYASSIALPLMSGSFALAVLTIYASETDVFDEEEVKLLKELAEDLTFGIVTHRSNLERQEAEAKAERLAKFDALTGLPNRVQLIAHTTQAIERAQPGESLAVMALSVDHFDEIQDGVGIAGADELLKEIASRLGPASGANAFLARRGGEVFAIVVPRVDAERARESAARLHGVMAEPFEYAGIPLDVQMTIGVALFPSHGTDAHSLLQRSDIAIRQARASGNDYALYSGTADTETPRRLTLLGELRRAIRSDGLTLHFQPKVDVHTGAVSGTEALVRWPHPTRGMVSPAEFIPLAEHTGLIKPITRWVLDAALEQVSRWQGGGLEIRTAINVSPHNLRDAEFLAHLEALHRTSGARLDLLDVEITETALMIDPARSREMLARISDLGMRVFIDDFGTGHSSLSYIATLPIHALKIDRSFVLAMMHQERHRAVVAAAISLAHSLGLKVVAEGIETVGQAKALIEQDCDEIQGYLFSPAVPADEFLRWQANFAWERFGLDRSSHRSATSR